MLNKWDFEDGIKGADDRIVEICNVQWQSIERSFKGETMVSFNNMCIIHVMCVIILIFSYMHVCALCHEHFHTC